MKTIFILFYFLFAISTAQSKPDNDDIIKKIDELELRIERLENSNIENQEKLEEVNKKAEASDKLSVKNNYIFKNEKEKKSFLSDLRLQLKTEEVKAKGGWTEQKNWSEIKNNLTAFKIRKLLGNPTSIKGSLNPRVERVYYYKGDLDADGNEEIGIVNFFRDKVVSFKKPW